MRENLLTVDQLIKDLKKLSKMVMEKQIFFYQAMTRAITITSAILQQLILIKI